MNLLIVDGNMTLPPHHEWYFLIKASTSFLILYSLYTILYRYVLRKPMRHKDIILDLWGQ